MLERENSRFREGFAGSGAPGRTESAAVAMC
jgi:hypothetical protein